MNSLKTQGSVALHTLMCADTLYGNPDTLGVLNIKEDKAGTKSGVGFGQKEMPEAEVDKSINRFIYRGSKESGLLFLLDDSDNDYFSPDIDKAFQNMLSALGISAQAVAVLNLATKENIWDFKLIMSFFSPTKLVLFGIETEDLGLPKINKNTFMTGRKAKVLNTLAFDKICADKKQKLLFWNVFKSFIA